MVNLTFYRLDVTFPIILWQFRSTTFHLFPFSVPFSGTVIHVGISLLIFEVHLVRCFPNCFCTFGHLLFGFRFPGEIFVFADLREDQVIFDDHGSWFRFAGCCWYHDGFFQTTAGVCSDQGQWINLNFLRFFDRFGRFCLLLCLCIILTWNPIDYRLKPLLLVVHQRIYWCCISSLCL